MHPLQSNDDGLSEYNDANLDPLSRTHNAEFSESLMWSTLKSLLDQIHRHAFSRGRTVCAAVQTMLRGALRKLNDGEMPNVPLVIQPYNPVTAHHRQLPAENRGMEISSEKNNPIPIPI